MKLLVVAAVVLAVLLTTRLYRVWQRRLQAETRAHPAVPSELLAGSDRTWLVFTTPYCATCEPVKERLASHDPGARLVTVDATREPHLADAFFVRSAPTVLLADGRGTVQRRLVGATAVNDYVASVAAANEG